MKSMYSFPSRSQTRDPRPRSSTTGPGEYTAAPRDGEFTPSISDCCARSYHSRDRSRWFVFVVISWSLKLEFKSRIQVENRSQLICRTAAIHHQRRSSHKRRIVRRQKQHGFRNFVDGPNPPHRPVLATRQIGFPIEAAQPRILRQHWSVHVAGANAVDADALPSVINRHRFGEQNDSALRGAIRHRFVATDDTPARTVVDDHSATLDDHRTERKLRHQERSLQVDVNLQVPFFFGAFQNRLRKEDSRIVKQNIEPPERAQRLVHRPLAFGGLADVCTQKN